ncbi:UNVERIFIED_CONTAM: hypothetical protein GTU68_026405 [Idotea baltica]|nr:hypothetical protein [Idotea baltica]
MPRSIKKGPFIDFFLLKKVYKLKNNVQIKTWSRRSTIIPDMTGFTFLVHNGRVHKPVVITESMVGYTLGSFSYTRAEAKHISKNEKNKK